MEDYLNETKLLYHYMDKCCELLSILFSEGDSSPTKKLAKIYKRLHQTQSFSAIYIVSTSQTYYLLFGDTSCTSLRAILCMRGHLIHTEFQWRNYPRLACQVTRLHYAFSA